MSKLRSATHHLRSLLPLRPFSASPNPSDTLSSSLPLFFSQPFSASTNPPSRLALSISSLLCKSSSATSDTSSATSDTSSATSATSSATPTPILPLPELLASRYSRVDFGPELILRILNISPSAGRSALSLLTFLTRHHPSFTLSDRTLSLFVDYFGRRRDFPTVHSLLSSHPHPLAGTLSFSAAALRLARAGRPTRAASLFHRMSSDYALPRDRASLSALVSVLCLHGFPSHAERLVKQVADEIFPDDSICDALVRGWCAAGKLDDARRLAGEIRRGGFDLGPPAYNAILDCVCRLCRRRDPFRLRSEADKVLLEMEQLGVPRDTNTFNVLINNLCKIRRTEDALQLFDRMREWGCSPNAETYLLLIKSLYQAARTAEGHEMIERMKSAGFTYALNRKAYYGFVKILCGIERLEDAIKVFVRMKKDGCNPGVKTYELLIGKLVAHRQVDRANHLFREGLNRGVPLTPKEYKVDPRFAKKSKSKKKEKPKRETLPMKMAAKRKRLRKLRLSFVKKPKPRMRMGY